MVRSKRRPRQHSKINKKVSTTQVLVWRTSSYSSNNPYSYVFIGTWTRKYFSGFSKKSPYCYTPSRAGTLRMWWDN